MVKDRINTFHQVMYMVLVLVWEKTISTDCGHWIIGPYFLWSRLLSAY